MRKAHVVASRDRKCKLMTPYLAKVPPLKSLPSALPSTGGGGCREGDESEILNKRHGIFFTDILAVKMIPIASIVDGIVFMIVQTPTTLC